MQRIKAKILISVLATCSQETLCTTVGCFHLLHCGCFVFMSGSFQHNLPILDFGSFEAQLNHCECKQWEISFPRGPRRMWGCWCTPAFELCQSSYCHIVSAEAFPSWCSSGQWWADEHNVKLDLKGSNGGISCMCIGPSLPKEHEVSPKLLLLSPGFIYLYSHICMWQSFWSC